MLFSVRNVKELGIILNPGGLYIALYDALSDRFQHWPIISPIFLEVVLIKWNLCFWGSFSRWFRKFRSQHRNPTENWQTGNFWNCRFFIGHGSNGQKWVLHPKFSNPRKFELNQTIFQTVVDPLKRGPFLWVRAEKRFVQPEFKQKKSRLKS